MIGTDWIDVQIAEIDARLATLDQGRALLEQLRERYVDLRAIHAGAPNGAGKSGASVAAEGGASRSDLEPERARTEPRVPGGAADGVSDPVASRVPSRRRSNAGDGVDRESALTAEGSTRLACPECERPVKNTKALGIHRSKSHGVPGRTASAAARTNGAAPPAPANAVAATSSGGPASKDRREIDEACPRGCGRRFRWEPSLLSHAASCKGEAESAPGGGPSK